jgi:hypothetical protein
VASIKFYLAPGGRILVDDERLVSGPRPAPKTPIPDIVRRGKSTEAVYVVSEAEAKTLAHERRQYAEPLRLWTPGGEVDLRLPWDDRRPTRDATILAADGRAGGERDFVLYGSKGQTVRASPGMQMRFSIDGLLSRAVC